MGHTDSQTAATSSHCVRALRKGKYPLKNTAADTAPGWLSAWKASFPRSADGEESER